LTATQKRQKNTTDIAPGGYPNKSNHGRRKNNYNLLWYTGKTRVPRGRGTPQRGPKVASGTKGRKGRGIEPFLKTTF